jgi:FtsH-binding integral membrane protein
VLFAVGSMLFVNKGSSDRENVALSIGGALAVGIAVFPMQTFCAANGKVSVHGACAVSFFLCIAYICVFCADETLKFILDEKKRQQYRNAYRTLAIVMVASPAVAVVVNALTLQQSRIFYVELLGILSFGVFWLVKSREIALITEERKSGKLDARLPAPV